MCFSSNQKHMTVLTGSLTSLHGLNKRIYSIVNTLPITVDATHIRKCFLNVIYSDSTVDQYPHQEFFGAAEGTWKSPISIEEALGTVPLQYHRKQNPYVPTRDDIQVVRAYLRLQNLPMELILQIMEMADYIPARRIPIPDDVFHLDNGEELRRYLNYCWQLLVRSDVLARACGHKIPWQMEVTYIVNELWGKNGEKLTTIPDSQQREVNDINLIKGAGMGSWIHQFI
jgi:hypothetical protein